MSVQAEYDRRAGYRIVSDNPVFVRSQRRCVADVFKREPNQCISHTGSGKFNL